MQFVLPFDVEPGVCIDGWIAASCHTTTGLCHKAIMPHNGSCVSQRQYLCLRTAQLCLDDWIVPPNGRIVSQWQYVCPETMQLYFRRCHHGLYHNCATGTGFQPRFCRVRVPQLRGGMRWTSNILGQRHVPLLFRRVTVAWPCRCRVPHGTAVRLYVRGRHGGRRRTAVSLRPRRRRRTAPRGHGCRCVASTECSCTTVGMHSVAVGAVSSMVYTCTIMYVHGALGIRGSRVEDERFGIGYFESDPIDHTEASYRLTTQNSHLKLTFTHMTPHLHNAQYPW